VVVDTKADYALTEWLMEEHAKADDFIPHRYLTQLTVWQV